MADARKIVERFIRQQVFRSRETPLEKFVLRSAGRGASEVETFDVPSEMNVDHIGIFTDEILTRAQSDADGLGTKLQKYILVACEVGRKDGTRQPFSVRGEGEEDDNDDDDGKPTEKGLTSQLMRHNEALMRMLVMTTGTQIQSMGKQLESKDKVIENMFQQRTRDLETVEEAKTLSHERDMQMMLTSGQEERKNELFKKLETLVPIVVNKLTGKQVLPEGAKGDIFKKFAETLGPDQIQQIAPFLTGEQQILLMTLLKAANEESAASEKQTPNPNGIH